MKKIKTQFGFILHNAQVCYINITVNDAEKESVSLNNGQTKMFAEKELIQYFIPDDPQSPNFIKSSKTKNDVSLRLIFKRQLMNEAMLTFFPTVLLISISYATSFFRLPTFFNTAITVNLTVMLTTTTLLLSVMTRLAKTSYIKWIEYWLIFAQLIPFVQVCFTLSPFKYILTTPVNIILCFVVHQKDQKCLFICYFF